MRNIILGIFLGMSLCSQSVQAAVEIKSGSTSTKANVDANNNLQVNTPITAAQAGFVKLADEKGSPVQFDTQGRLDISMEHLFLTDPVDGAAVDSKQWAQSTSTMTIVQASNLITLNSGSSLTTSAYAILTSFQRFQILHESALHVRGLVIPVNGSTLNKTMEFGIGAPATTAAITDGAIFRWYPTGEFKCVVINTSIETASAALTLPTDNVAHRMEIKAWVDEVSFYIDGVEVAKLTPPAGQSSFAGLARLPIYSRVFNAASAPSTASQLKFGDLAVTYKLYNYQRPWSLLQNALGRGSWQTPLTAYAQTSNHTNSTSPTSATLSNTTAGYTTLGGRFQFAAVAGSATDYALFAYQVPADYRLVITGVNITTVNTGAATATTATILDWSVGINASAVSLATADSFGTNVFAPRRIPLGVQGMPVFNTTYSTGADIGYTPQMITANYTNDPIVIEQGRYVHIILQIPVGTATASQVIRGDVTIIGHFE